MSHNFGTVLLCPQNLAVSGANQVLHNIVAGNFYRGNMVLLSPSNGPFASKFQELGVAVRIGEVDELLQVVRDVRFAVCNTIMTAHIVNKLTARRIPCAWVLHEWWTQDMIPIELGKRNDENLTIHTVETALRTCAATVSVCAAQQKLYGPAHGEIIFVGTPDVELRSFSSPKQTPITFLCMGIVCPRKNQAFTVKCFKAFAKDRQDVRLLVVGVRRIRDYEISYVKEVEKAADGDPRIELHDVTHEVDAYYAQADVVVLASLNEVTPMVLAEAMARGKPVLTTGIAGIPEMVNNGVEGFVCGEEDTPCCVAEWAHRMDELASSASLRQQMGEAGLSRYENQFRLQHMVDQYKDIARRLAKPVVLVDMDGCLVDWDQGFLNAWNGRTLVDRSHYEMEKCVPADMYQEAVALFESEGFFRSLPAMSGGIDAAKRLVRSGFEVFICTSPVVSSRYCAQEKWEWVREHLGDEWLKRLILTCDKTTVQGDFLIDDKPAITGSQQPLWTQILFDAPYNQKVELGHRRRLCCWDDVEAVIYDELASPIEANIEQLGVDSHGECGLKTVGSLTSMTSDDVAQLQDFSHELGGTTYTKDYNSWRKGLAKGAKGDFRQAVKEIDAITKRLFLEGDDWSSVHTFRRDYQSWRQGKARGAKNTMSGNALVGAL